MDSAYHNELGQIFTTGETVLFMGTSWGSTSLREGIFDGVHDGKIRIKDPKWLQLKETEGGAWEYETFTGRTTYLQYNRIYKTDTPLSAFVGKRI